MAETATKMPVETETQAPAVREKAGSPFDALRREIDRLFDDYRAAGWRILKKAAPIFGAATR